jgi:hypothetical protein
MCGGNKESAKRKDKNGEKVGDGVQWGGEEKEERRRKGKEMESV